MGARLAIRISRCGATPAITAVALIGGLVAQNAPPRAAELIHRALAARKAQDAKGWQYTSREDTDQWELDKQGRHIHQTRTSYEHIMLEGGDYKKLILVNGKPLDAKAQKKADADEERERAERRLHPLQPGFHYGGSLDRLEELFDNKVTGEETVSGRKAWRMESEPKPGYRPADQAEEQLLAMRHVFWFDEEDGMEIRETGVLLQDSGGLPRGSKIEIGYAKAGDAWLIDHATLETEFGGTHSQASGYKRFTVDATLTPQ